MTYYLLLVEGDVEMQDPVGPFPTAEAQLARAREERAKDPNGENGIFWLDIDSEGKPSTGSYSRRNLQPEAVE